MTGQDLFKVATELEKKIYESDTAQRLALQPEFSRVLERLAEGGQDVPLRLRRLNTKLCDEAIEDWFDNMPV